MIVRGGEGEKVIARGREGEFDRSWRGRESDRGGGGGGYRSRDGEERGGDRGGWRGRDGEERGGDRGGDRGGWRGRDGEERGGDRGGWRGREGEERGGDRGGWRNRDEERGGDRGGWRGRDEDRGGWRGRDEERGSDRGGDRGVWRGGRRDDRGERGGWRDRERERGKMYIYTHIIIITLSSTDQGMSRPYEDQRRGNRRKKYSKKGCLAKVQSEMCTLAHKTQCIIIYAGIIVRAVALLGVGMVMVRKQHLLHHHVIDNLQNPLVTGLLLPRMKVGKLSIENVEFI